MEVVRQRERLQGKKCLDRLLKAESKMASSEFLGEISQVCNIVEELNCPPATHL